MQSECTESNYFEANCLSYRVIPKVILTVNMTQQNSWKGVATVNSLVRAMKHSNPTLFSQAVQALIPRLLNKVIDP